MTADISVDRIHNPQLFCTKYLGIFCLGEKCVFEYFHSIRFIRVAFYKIKAQLAAAI